MVHPGDESKFYNAYEEKKVVAIVFGIVENLTYLLAEYNLCSGACQTILQIV
jgi:hypothetical protein